eukprot:s624_g8.t1
MDGICDLSLVQRSLALDGKRSRRLLRPQPCYFQSKTPCASGCLKEITLQLHPCGTTPGASGDFLSQNSSVDEAQDI